MLGWLLGGETFLVSSLLGAALVLAGVWMIFRKAKVKEAATEGDERVVQFPER